LVWKSSSKYSTTRRIENVRARYSAQSYRAKLINRRAGSVFQRQLFNLPILNSVQLEANRNEHREWFEPAVRARQTDTTSVLNPHITLQSVNENLSAAPWNGYASGVSRNILLAGGTWIKRGCDIFCPNTLYSCITSNNVTRIFIDRTFDLVDFLLNKRTCVMLCMISYIFYIKYLKFLLFCLISLSDYSDHVISVIIFNNISKIFMQKF